MDKHISTVSLYGLNVYVGEYVGIRRWLERAKKSPCRIVTLNPLILMEAKKSSHQWERLKKASLIVPDGIGICRAIHKKFHFKQRPLTGIDMISRCLHEETLTFFFLGSTPEISEKATNSLKKKYPKTSIHGHHGYFSEKEWPDILNKIVESKADIICVGMGYPKQEDIAEKLMPQLNKGCVIGVGGAIDVFGGNVKRAPRWAQYIGMEWLHRIILQPNRIKKIPELIRFLFVTP